MCAVSVCCYWLEIERYGSMLAGFFAYECSGPLQVSGRCHSLDFIFYSVFHEKGKTMRLPSSYNFPVLQI